MLGLATFFSSILLGCMLFFTTIVAPSIFKSLDDDAALKFTRYVFPKYYLWGIAVSALAAGFALAARTYTCILLSIIFLGFVYGRQILRAKMTHAKDQWLASDSAQDKSRYKSLHKRSIIINASQMALLLIVVVTQLLHLRQL